LGTHQSSEATTISKKTPFPYAKSKWTQYAKAVCSPIIVEQDLFPHQEAMKSLTQFDFNHFRATQFSYC
jgi:hypothetical protein